MMNRENQLYTIAESIKTKLKIEDKNKPLNVFYVEKIKDETREYNGVVLSDEYFNNYYLEGLFGEYYNIRSLKDKKVNKSIIRHDDCHEIRQENGRKVYISYDGVNEEEDKKANRSAFKFALAASRLKHNRNIAKTCIIFNIFVNYTLLGENIFERLGEYNLRTFICEWLKPRSKTMEQKGYEWFDNDNDIVTIFKIAKSFGYKERRRLDGQKGEIVIYPKVFPMSQTYIKGTFDYKDEDISIVVLPDNQDISTMNANEIRNLRSNSKHICLSPMFIVESLIHVLFYTRDISDKDKRFVADEILHLANDLCCITGGYTWRDDWKIINNLNPISRAQLNMLCRLDDEFGIKLETFVKRTNNVKIPSRNGVFYEVEKDSVEIFEFEDFFNSDN